MRSGALRPYERSLRTATELCLLSDDGRRLALDVDRWLPPADRGDATVLARCQGPVLDVGCGPGRFVRALSERSIVCLGVDIAQAAVSITRDSGAAALLRDVFAPIPGEGRWPTALLMDGNIGIGGDPQRLLARVASLLAPDGRVIVEASPDPSVDARLTVRFVTDGTAVGPSFQWAEVGLDGLDRYARQAGLYVEETWSVSGRRFASLVSRRTRTR